MRFLPYIVLFIVGGAIGFYLGGAWKGASSVAGTQIGVCSAAKVAGQLGILSAEEQNRLLGETSGHLRSEFPEIAKEFGLADQPPLSLDRCAEFAEAVDSQHRQRGDRQPINQENDTNQNDER